MVLALKRINWGKLFLPLIPYILIFIASAFGGIVLFYNGFPSGDDIAFHFSNIYDMYLDLKSGSISPISDLLTSGLGFGKNLFYSPFVHLSTSILAIMLEPFGVSLLQALKINLFLSIYLSGIFMYRFGMHISKNKRMVALIAAFVFVLYPYRYFDMICRVALAEAYAFLFMPLFFMGLYDFIHLEDQKRSGMLSFLEIILGGSLLFLTHNITAIFCYFFGVIYLLFHVKRIYYLFKYDKSLILYAVISIFLLLGIAAKTLFSAYSLYATGIYNVSIPERMWTSAEYLAARNDFEWYSGLLNLEYFTSWNSGITVKSAVLDAVVFSVLTLGMLIIDYFLAKIKYLKLIHPLIISAIGIPLGFLFAGRTEVSLGILLFHITYLFFSYTKKDEIVKLSEALAFVGITALIFVVSMVFYKAAMWGLFLIAGIAYTVVYSLTMEKKKGPKLYKEGPMDLYFLIFASVLTIILIVGGNIWYIVPSILRSIQFPWRLFAFLAIFASILSAEILKNFKTKYIFLSGIALASFLMVCSEAIPEKRIVYNSNKNNLESTRWNYEIDDSYLSDWGSFGACREYFPYMYYFNDNYQKTYENSLYPKVKKFITNKNYYNQPLDVTSVILEGSGEVIETNHEAPIVDLELKVESSDALIQIPLIYYPGYKVILLDKDGNSFEIDAIMVDGLVSFRASKGEYTCHTYYKGTTIMRLGNYYQQVAIPLTLGFAALALFYDNKKNLWKENVLYKEK